MATAIINQIGTYQFGGSPPFGNLSVFRYGFTTNASGVVQNSDATAALAIGDVIDLGVLQEGLNLSDASIFVTTALTASVTASLGFKYSDGVDSTSVPQDAAYFGTSIDMATTGRKRATGASLVTLPKEARLILTIAGANNAKASDVKIIVSGELIGFR